MISLPVKFIRHLQNSAGTKFHTKATSFTPVFDNMDFCRWYRFLPQIKRFSPHLHGNNPALKFSHSVPFYNFSDYSIFVLLILKILNFVNNKMGVFVKRVFNFISINHLLHFRPNIFRVFYPTISSATFMP